MSLELISKKSDRAPAKVPAAGLRIGAPGDALERDADRVANQAMGRSWSLSEFSIGAPAQQAEAPPIVHEVLGSQGRPLEPAARRLLEPKFGHDFGDVRIHSGSRAAESADAVQANAYTVGNRIVLGSEYAPGSEAGNRLLAHELAHTLQPKHGASAVLRRDPKAAPEAKLVDDFAAKFPAAASLIKPNPAAMKLIKEAFAAGVVFGGYAEDGPSKDIGRSYTLGNTVYILKTNADPPVMAMRDFLFELNNAIGQPKATALITAATKGVKTDAAAARTYAHDRTDGEVEGMLRLGEVWFETKAKYLGTQAHAFDQYDRQFYLAEYQAFKDHKKTREDIVQDVLKRKYDTGTLKGKTVEQFYIEQYQGLAK